MLIKRLETRAKKTFLVTKEVKAKEDYRFSRPRKFRRPVSISAQEAEERLLRDEEVTIERVLQIDHHDQERTMRIFKEVLRSESELKEYVAKHAAGSIPRDVYLTQGPEYTIGPENYQFAAGLDTNNDLVISREEFTEGPAGLIDAKLSNGAAPPGRTTGQPGHQLLRGQEPQPELLKGLQQAQSSALLGGNFSEALSLSDGQALLADRDLLADGSMGLAILVNQKSRDENLSLGDARKKLSEGSGPDAKAYRALTSAIEASAAGSFFPAAPLMSQVRDRLDLLRQARRNDLGALGTLTTIDELMAVAEPEETLLDFFSRVNQNPQSRKSFGVLMDVLREDTEFGKLDSVKFEDLASRAGAELDRGEIQSFRAQSQALLADLDRKLEDVTRPELQERLLHARQEVERRLVRLRELDQEVLQRREEEAVSRTVASILNDNSVSEFTERARLSISNTLAESRADLSIAELEKLPLDIGPAEPESSDSVGRGYTVRSELMSNLGQLKLRALMGGDTEEALALAAGTEELRPLEGHHNGELHRELLNKFETLPTNKEQILAGRSKFQQDRELGPLERGELAVYALQKATDMTAFAGGHSLRLSDLEKRLADLEKQRPADVVSREMVGRARILILEARGSSIEEDPTADVVADYAYTNSQAQSLEQLVKLLALERSAAPTKASDLNQHHSIEFFRSGTEQSKALLESKLETVGKEELRAEINIALSVLDDRLASLDSLSQNLKEAVEEASVNALVSKVFEDQTESKAELTTERSIRAAAEASAESELARWSY